MANEVRLSFAMLWQTALALPLAFLIYMLGVLIGGGIYAYLTTWSAFPGHGFNSVWLLAASGWIGVWCAYHACEWIFKAYSGWAIFLMLTLVSLVNFIDEIGHATFWDITARGAQGTITCLTAYAFFCHEKSRQARVQP